MIRRYHDPSETQAQNRPLLSVSVTRFDDSNYRKNHFLHSNIKIADPSCSMTCSLILCTLYYCLNTILSSHWSMHILLVLSLSLPSGDLLPSYLNAVMVKANGLLVVLDVDFIKSLVDIMMELLHKDDKIGRLTALGKSPEPEVTQTCSLETEEVVYSEPPPSTKQAVQKKDTFKFHASLQNFRVAIVEDATKSNPTALLLRVCGPTCGHIHTCMSFACTCMSYIYRHILCYMFVLLLMLQAETFAHLQFDLQKNSLRASLQLSNFGVSACSVLEMDNPMTHVRIVVQIVCCRTCWMGVVDGSG